MNAMLDDLEQCTRQIDSLVAAAAEESGLG